MCGSLQRGFNIIAGCSLLLASIASSAAGEDAFQAFGAGLSGAAADSPAPAIEPVEPIAAQLKSTPAPAARRAVAAPYPRRGASRPWMPVIESPMTSQTRQVLGFYGGYSARTTLSQMPRRSSLASASAPAARPFQKPFQGVESVQSESTLSPYLNLDREETALDLPNYHTFVRPQAEQREANRLQQRQIQMLQRQVQNNSTPFGRPQQRTSNLQGTGTTARFMDTAQYYSGPR